MQKYKNLTKAVHWIFPRFYVMADLFGSFWVQNGHVSYFSCHRLAFSNNFRNPLLLRASFHTNFSNIFFESVTFTCSRASAPFNLETSKKKNFILEL